MAYPASIDSFPVIAGTTLLADATALHNVQHNNAGSAIVNIQTTLGTNAGTSVIKNFTAGDFAARINSSNVLQQTLQGTLNNSVIGTPTITGGTVTASLLGTNTITGGTLNGQIVNSGTIGGGLFGTVSLLGGTANNLTLGTPIIRAWNGWEDANETWTSIGTSAQLGTLGLPVTGTTKYQVGDPIQFTQGGSTLYMNIIGLSGTTALVTGGTQFVLTNGAITNPQYAKMPNPLNFPFYFGFTPTNLTWDATSPASGTIFARYSITGRRCEINMRVSYATAGTTNTVFNFDTPIPANQTDAVYHTIITGGMSPNNDNSLISTAGQSQAIVFGTTPTIYVKLTTTNMNAKAVWAHGVYQI